MTGKICHGPNVHILVNVRNLLLQMLANSGEATTIDADHGQLVDFTQTSQVEKSESNDTDFFVRL